jgi:hypothetical protein
MTTHHRGRWPGICLPHFPRFLESKTKLKKRRKLPKDIEYSSWHHLCFIIGTHTSRAVLKNIFRWLQQKSPPRKQEVPGRINCLLSFQYILSIWYDMDYIENTMSNSSSVVVYVFVPRGTCFLSHCLAMLRGRGTHRHTDNKVIP